MDPEEQQEATTTTTTTGKCLKAPEGGEASAEGPGLSWFCPALTLALMPAMALTVVVLAMTHRQLVNTVGV